MNQLELTDDEIAAYRDRLTTPCTLCQSDELMAVLTDPQTHALLKPLRDKYFGLVQVHLHKNGILDVHVHEELVFKLLIPCLRIRYDMAPKAKHSLIFTLGAATLKGAIAYVKRIEESTYELRRTARP